MSLGVGIWQYGEAIMEFADFRAQGHRSLRESAHHPKGGTCVGQSVADSSKSGFALVVTLSLMILLTIITVVLLTLSSISLMASSQGSSASIARTNARLATMLALGDLQKFMGPDQSVSATASAVVANAKRPISARCRSN